MIKNNF